MLNGTSDRGLSGQFSRRVGDKRALRIPADLRRLRARRGDISPQLREAFEEKAPFPLREQIARRCVITGSGQLQTHAA